MSFFRDIEKQGRKLLIKLLTRLNAVSPYTDKIKKIRSVIILRIDERLGNVVLLNSVIHSFMQNRMTVTLMVCQKFGQIYEDTRGLKEIIYFNKKELFNPVNICKLINRIRKQQYDLLFDASNPNDLSTLSLFLMILIRARIKIGFNRKNSSSVLNELIERPEQKQHMLKYYGLLFKRLHLKFYQQPYVSISQARLKKIRIPVHDHRKIIIAHPGGRGFKQWDERKMISFLKRIDHKKYSIICILGPDELSIKDMFETENFQTIMPKDVFELAAVLSKGIMYIGNDSGPMHLAAALKLSILAVFKPDASIVFQPLAKKCRIIVTDTPFNVSPDKVYHAFKKLL